MAAPLTEAAYRNPFEVGVGEQLSHAKVPFEYEPLKMDVSFPARIGKYTPDFVFKSIKVVVETKGTNPKYFDADARQKMILCRDQHPDWDFWLLFQKPNGKIYKGSKTTFEAWAADKGFKAACGKTLPLEWIAELRQRLAEARKPKQGRRTCRSTRSSGR